MRLLRAFSAAMTLGPVAEAPGMLETEAVYCPFVSSTLPEYCLPPTVVEKLTACISAALLLALAGGAAWACALLACAAGAGGAVLAGDELGVAWADAGAEAGADGEAVAGLETTTGFKTGGVGATDGMLVSCMALLPPGMKIGLPHIAHRQILLRL
jgi:hypothetical protein